MTDVQKALNRKSYNDGHAFGMFFGCILGFIVGIAAAVLILTFVI